MTATQADPNARLDDPESHAAGLTLAATRLLRAGQPRRAFELANRRCRLDEAPGPAHWAIRALAGRLCGWPFWREDLARALRADPLDPVVNTTLLRLGSDEERRAAAHRIVASPEASTIALEDALSHLFDAGERAVTRLDLVDNRLSGWVAWRGAGRPVLAIDGPVRTLELTLASDDALAVLPAGAKAAQVEALLPFEQVRTFAVRLADETLAGGTLLARSRRADRPSTAHAPVQTPEHAALVVLVPVYGDLDATRACLDAAAAEVGGRANTRLVVVDDAAPDPTLVRHLDALAESGRIELKRNDVNLGFAGAVRRGLAEAGGCDVLLLNADAILPEGALDRLTRAAYGAPDIGTVTPLSNNGEYSSFPRPGVANPVPAPEEARHIDAAAARLAGDVVDLPTGTGFCLYLRHDCRAAVGDMPAIYGRGYFEDMEFCLRARESGFRSVCAPSVFVVHHGSLSFGAEKAALVSTNLRILRQRFPGIRAECAAYVAADPLRPARAALEAELAAPQSLPLLVSREGGALLQTRLAHHGGRAFQLLWSTAGGHTVARLLGPDGAAPQSLRFDVDPGDLRLGADLAARTFAEIELLGSDETPPGLLDALLATAAAFDVVLGDVPLAVSPDDGHFAAPLARTALRLGGRLRQVVAAEDQSFAVLSVEGGLPPGVALVDGRAPPGASVAYACPADAPPSIGILSPAPQAATDAFVRTLSGLLHRHGSPARLVVLGNCVDAVALMARGNVLVTGAVPAEEEADLLRLHGVRALVLPPASPFLAEAARIAGRHALPLACSDWTSGRLPPRPFSLFLDPHDRDAGNALAIADWFAHRLEAPPP